MNILLLSPHADDIELGCGGAVERFVEEKHSILWVVFTATELLIYEHMEAIREVGLTIDECLNLDYENRRLFERRQDILDRLIAIKTGFKPDLVIGPSLKDCHQDHNVVAKEMVRAFKTSSSIICYELPWNHITFDTQIFVRLDKRHAEKKMAMLRKFNSQLPLRARTFTKEFVMGALAVRGAQVGSEYAEAFEALRWII